MPSVASGLNFKAVDQIRQGFGTVVLVVVGVDCVVMHADCKAVFFLRI